MASKNFSSRKILDFFPTKTKSNQLPSCSENFYRAKLLEASQNSENSVACETGVNGSDNELLLKLEKANEEIRTLKETVERQNKDIKALKYLVNSANRLCVAKDLKIESLLKQPVENGQSDIAIPILFKRFEKMVESSTLKQLRSVQFGQKYDSTFVLTLVRHFYSNNINSLLTKTATGSKQGKGKTAVSSEKKRLIHELLKERVISEESNGFCVENRLNRISDLLNDAIYNIVRPLKRVT